MPPLSVTIDAESWPLASAFVISRGSKTEAAVVVVQISDGITTGRGECAPYARYGETVASVTAQIGQARPILAANNAHAARLTLQECFPPGAARNALDCALWDFEAKQACSTVAELTGAPAARPLLTAYTLSLDTPEAMAAKARAVSNLPLLKLKLGGPGDDARLKAVRAARPDARLIADANEAWTSELLLPFLEAARQAGLELIEQPLPAGDDAALEARPPGIVICADESLHTRADLPRLARRYDAINIKLDKAGGLTEALALATDARKLDLKIMAGCMVSTSLAMAPALIVAQQAHWVDLDGPLLLARDRESGLTIHDGLIMPSLRKLWG